MTEKDRDYYRCLSNRELLEEARRGVRVAWEELATVLAERIEINERDWECPECGY